MIAGARAGRRDARNAADRAEVGADRVEIDAGDGRPDHRTTHPRHAPVREVLEARVFLDERQLRGAGRAVALLADDDLGHALRLLVRLPVVVAVLLLAVDEHDDVGVLLEGAGLAQVRELRAVIGARLRRARQLRQRDDRHVQLLREPLQRPRDRRELRLPALEAAAALHQLDVVDDEQVEPVLGLQPARLGAHLEHADRRACRR